MALFVGLDVSLKTVWICIVKADGTVVWEGKALSDPVSLIKALGRRRKYISLVGIEACPLSEWLYGALIDAGFTTICIVDDSGKILFEKMVATDPQVIATHLRKHAPGLERFGLESGSTSAWLWREFRHLGLPVICLDSRHAHRILSMKRNKNDRNDARGLADLVRMGWYREARVRSLDAQFVRSMLLSRQQLLQSRRAIENQIRGALKTLGVLTSSTKGRGFMPRVKELRAENGWLGPVLDPLLNAHASIATQLKAVSASVLAVAREDADVRRMMTVPGIGAMTALAFKAAVDDPKRFTSSTKVGPYLGLTPRQHQSGESEWVGGIGKTNDPLLRAYLYEAAGVLMTRVRRVCPLKAWALRLAKRVGWKRASIAVARKLAVIMHAIWRDGTEFEWAKAEAA